MASLTGNSIAGTYSGLLKFNDNGAVESGLKNITDGTGGATALSLGSAQAALNGTVSITGSTTQLGSVTITGSLKVTQGVTGSLVGTASWASQALTASYVVTALTASYVTSSNVVGTVASASFATTASYVVQSISSSFASTASYVTSSNIVGTVTSASFATTASHALTTNTASLLITASVSQNTITFTKGNGSTFPILVATGSAFPFSGNASITGSLAISGSLSINPSGSLVLPTTASTAPTTGAVYFNFTTNKLYAYNGTTWVTASLGS